MKRLIRANDNSAEFDDLYYNDRKKYREYTIAAANFFAPYIKEQFKRRNMNHESMSEEYASQEGFQKYLDVVEELRSYIFSRNWDAEYNMNKQHPWMKFMKFEQFMEDVGVELENEYDITGFYTPTSGEAGRVFNISEINNLQDLREVIHLICNHYQTMI